MRVCVCDKTKVNFVHMLIIKRDCITRSIVEKKISRKKINENGSVRSQRGRKKESKVVIV